MTIVKNALIIKTLKQLLYIVLITIVAGLTSNLLRSDKTPFFENWTEKIKHASLSGENLEISLEKAVQLFRQNGAIFMDARSLEEYNEGHIKGAISFPYMEVDSKFVEIMSEIPEDSVIITYCDGETCELSIDLADFLRNTGYKKVWALLNGWTVWQQNRLPVESVN
ncbi:MAG: rhodanese-like domain-containing protein [Pseudomonadota bacterium]